MQEAETKGYDAGKKIKGRKRHLLVDTLRLLLVSWMTTANVQDRDATPAGLPLAAQHCPTLKKVWVDGGGTPGRKSKPWPRSAASTSRWRRSLWNGLERDGTVWDTAGYLLPSIPGGCEVRARFCWEFRTARRGFDSRRRRVPPGLCAGWVERPRSHFGVHAYPSRLPRRGAAGAWLSWLAVGGLSFNTTRSGAALAQGPQVRTRRGQPQVLHNRSHPSCSLHVRQHPPPASTPQAREHIQGERPAQQPGLVQTGCALLPRLLHRRGKGGALLLQPRLRPSRPPATLYPQGGRR